MKKSLISVALCATLAQAGVFSIDVTNDSNTQTFSETFTSVEDAFESLDADAIQERISYSETDGISANVDFRGLPMTLQYEAGASNILTLEVPSIGITEVFSGATRDESIDALEDWLKENGASAVESIMKKLAEVSPVDPIAGNPNSIMSTSVASDFDSGFTSVATKQDRAATSSKSSSSANSISISPSYSALDVDGIDSTSYFVPLAYSFNLDRDINEKIIVSIPISYTDVEGSTSASIGFGLAYAKPINSDWTLTPALSYGATGSADLGSLAQVASFSLTSSYTWDLKDDYTLSMGNMVGYYSSVKFYSGDYAYDPGISNTVYRNALMLNVPTNEIANNTSVELFAIDTRFTGSALYLEEYQEYGLSYGYDLVNVNMLSNSEKYSVRRSLKVGLSYLSSSKANGFKANFGYVF